MNHTQLIFAREYRGYSQTELAKNIDGLSQSNLSKFEKGINVLSDDILMKIIKFLDFPLGFFEQKISIVCENAEYRKRATITKKQRSYLDYTNKLIGFIVDQMSISVEWPEFKLIPIDLEEGYTPEYAASYTRKTLNIKEGDPVNNIFQMLESKGVIVAEIDAFEKFDGVSFLTDEGYPVIAINKNFDNDRKRFSLAHELGHIIMHLAGGFPIPLNRDKEMEANTFASEFLMPAQFVKNALRNLKLSYLADLKRYWLTSMSSIIRRAKDLGCINYDRYRYLNIELSRSGQKKKESIKVPIDKPTLLQNGFNLHFNELGYSLDELCEAFKLPLDILKRIYTENKSDNRLRVA
ncbi:helix-turn-helix domain-containing protein [Leeuwenhoekiella blandensis]|uniref:DNA-binding helix-turn-helix protein n=1 Tax=Leeuwenhoekiella blandensis (strain CECT 7118 / CCUG 51940 / KCTC 22103 / MED217) TaxID=398720 RepID=A3XRB0_LEEBM|nr:XRE family transcriptional regulator [Leeuwenhoekiella blandensis]EAQ47915.1 DNA-binding helix-turn-helix protein [Leeuwenhoekiella blandensis MED217]